MNLNTYEFGYLDVKVETQVLQRGKRYLVAITETPNAPFEYFKHLGIYVSESDAKEMGIRALGEILTEIRKALVKTEIAIEDYQKKNPQ